MWRAPQAGGFPNAASKGPSPNPRNNSRASACTKANASLSPCTSAARVTVTPALALASARARVKQPGRCAMPWDLPTAKQPQQKTVWQMVPVQCMHVSKRKPWMHIQERVRTGHIITATDLLNARATVQARARFGFGGHGSSRRLLLRLAFGRPPRSVLLVGLALVPGGGANDAGSEAAGAAGEHGIFGDVREDATAFARGAWAPVVV